MGPTFVKFGQIISTRIDILPNDIAIALATLQDDVPPCSKRVQQYVTPLAAKKTAL